MTTTDADRLRIAVALTALKFKPAEQSCASYILHLWSIFPPSTPAAPTADGSWKNHALALEKDLAKMKEKYRTEQIKVISQTPSASASEPGESQPVKRKPKKKLTEKIPARTDLETVLASLDGRPEFVSLPNSDSLLCSFSALHQLSTALSSSETTVTTSQRSLLVSTTIHCLTALSNVLHPILRSTEPTVASQATTLHTLAALLHQLVSSSLPFLLRKPKQSTNKPGTVSPLLNKILDALITLIFNPILESFSPLSHRYLTCLFSPTSPDLLPTDLRADVLHLFQSGFSSLVSAPSAYELDVRCTLALTALRELENLFPPRNTANARQPWTHDSRVNALARKDALWYMCTVLHVLFGPTKGSSMAGSTGAILESRITDSLSRIASRCRGCQESRDGHETPHLEQDLSDLDLQVIDEVGYGMILGIMERFWRCTGQVHQD